MGAVVSTRSWAGVALCPGYTPAVGIYLNSECVVGVFGEVSAASMAGRNVLNTVKATDRMEGTLRTGTVGIAFGPVLSDLMIDFRDLLCVAAHEEERDAEQGGNGQHDD